MVDATLVCQGSLVGPLRRDVSIIGNEKKHGNNGGNGMGLLIDYDKMDGWSQCLFFSPWYLPVSLHFSTLYTVWLFSDCLGRGVPGGPAD